MKGSHRCGRIQHISMNGLTQADPERVTQMLGHFELVNAEMNPGTV